MKALEIGVYPHFEVREVPTPEPQAGEILLRVEAVTTCPQWDLHLRHQEPMFIGHQFHYPYPLGQPGHEATGIVAGLGERVTQFAIGDRVSAWRDPGHQKQGCYAQFVVLNAENVIRVPEALPYAKTASVELAMCVSSTILMLKEMNALRGRVVGIVGLGPAGLIAAQLARAEGAKEVIGFDLSETRRDHAVSFCVDCAFDPRSDLGEAFPARPRSPRLECTIDCVGAKASVEWAMDRTKETVALFGVQREDYVFQPRHYGHLRLCGYPGHSRPAAEYAVEKIGSGELDLSPLLTCHLPLSRYNEGIDLLERQEAIKVCFRPWLD